MSATFDTDDRVTVIEDLPEHNVRYGTVATVTHCYEYPNNVEAYDLLVAEPDGTEREITLNVTQLAPADPATDVVPEPPSPPAPEASAPVARASLSDLRLS